MQGNEIFFNAEMVIMFRLNDLIFKFDEIKLFVVMMSTCDSLRGGSI